MSAKPAKETKPEGPCVSTEPAATSEEAPANANAPIVEVPWTFHMLIGGHQGLQEIMNDKICLMGQASRAKRSKSKSGRATAKLAAKAKTRLN